MRPRTKTEKPGELSRAVKQLREALHQTQQEFAQTLKTAITTIARYETGRAPNSRSLAKLAEVAAQNNLTEFAQVFRHGLTRELGTWDTTGLTLDIDPRDDTERLYIAAVVSILRNPQFTHLIPRLNILLRGVAEKSIEKLNWAKKSVDATRIARAMSKAGKTAEEISATIGVPIDEVRNFQAWTRFEEQIKARSRRPKVPDNE